MCSNHLVAVHNQTMNMPDDLPSVAQAYAGLWLRVPENHPSMAKYISNGVFMLGYRIEQLVPFISALKHFQDKYIDMRPGSKFYWMMNPQIEEWIDLNETLISQSHCWPDHLADAFDDRSQFAVIVMMVPASDPSSTGLSILRRSKVEIVDMRIVETHRSLLEHLTGECGQCKKPAALYCLSCIAVPYCSRACQKKHFKIHKNHCAGLRERINIVRLSSLIDETFSS